MRQKPRGDILTHRHGRSVSGPRPRSRGVSAKPSRLPFAAGRMPRVSHLDRDPHHCFSSSTFLPIRFHPQGRGLMSARQRLPTSILLLIAGSLGAAIADERKSAFPESVGREVSQTESSESGSLPPGTRPVMSLAPESTSALAALTVTVSANKTLPQPYGATITW